MSSGDNKGGRKKKICLVLGLIAFYGIRAQASTLPPDPDNAALLYYQAFILRPEPDEIEKELAYNNRLDEISAILQGGELDFDPRIEKEIQELEKRIKNREANPNQMTLGAERKLYDEAFLLNELKRDRELDEKMRSVDPNKKIREYMNMCRRTIELVRAASKLPMCDWGIRYSQGLACRLPQLSEIRPLARILCVDALLLAADGNDRAAMERCLMIRRFAHQVGDDSYLLYCVSKAVDRQALECLQILLGYIEPDVDVLTWLKNQLDTKKGSPALADRALKMDFEMALQSLRMNSSMLENVHEAMLMKEEIKGAEREKLKQEEHNDLDIQNLTDEELIALAGEPYATFLDSAIRAMKSEMSYEKQFSEIQRLTESLKKEFGNDPSAQLKMIAHPEKLLTLSIVNACAEQVLRGYKVHVNGMVRFNTLIAGIELYLIEARTGQLPGQLPDDMPKDPFTGRDFMYEITEGGFKLSLPGKRPSRLKLRPYEFKVRK